MRRFLMRQTYVYLWFLVPICRSRTISLLLLLIQFCLVNALYSVFQNGHPGFQAKYLDMLRAGGTKRHKELLAPFGLNAADPAFWSKGLGVIEGFIDELEKAQ